MIDFWHCAGFLFLLAQDLFVDSVRGGRNLSCGFDAACDAFPQQSIFMHERNDGCRSQQQVVSCHPPGGFWKCNRRSRGVLGFSDSLCLQCIVRTVVIYWLRTSKSRVIDSRARVLQFTSSKFQTNLLLICLFVKRRHISAIPGKANEVRVRDWLSAAKITAAFFNLAPQTKMLTSRYFHCSTLFKARYSYLSLTLNYFLISCTVTEAAYPV